MCVCGVCECERCNTFFICHFGLFLRLFGHFTFAATTSSSRRQKVPPSHRKKQNPQRHRRCGINFRFSLGFFLSFTLPERERAMYHVTSVSRAAAESKKSHKIMNQMWIGNEKRRAEKKASQLTKVEEHRGEGVTRGRSLVVLCNRPCCFRLG